MILRGLSASMQTEASGTPLSDLPNSELSEQSVALDVTDAVDVADGKAAGRGARAQQPRHAVGTLPQDKPYVAGPVSMRTIKIPSFHPADAGVWQPLARGHHAMWETGWPSSPSTQEPPIRGGGHNSTVRAGSTDRRDAARGSQAIDRGHDSKDRNRRPGPLPTHRRFRRPPSIGHRRLTDPSFWCALRNV